LVLAVQEMPKHSLQLIEKIFGEVGLLACLDWRLLDPRCQKAIAKSRGHVQLLEERIHVTDTARISQANVARYVLFGGLAYFEGYTNI